MIFIGGGVGEKSLHGIRRVTTTADFSAWAKIIWITTNR
jgi:hypothetical protein